MSARMYEELRKLDMAVRPLEARHKMVGRGKASSFRATAAKTRALLEQELKLLKAKQLVMQLDLQEDQIRMDGWPRAGKTPRTPIVVLSFDSKVGPLEFVADTFSTVEENVRAIALTLEQQRALERYGVVKAGQQYTGWLAIPQTTGPTLGEELVAKYGSVTKAMKMTHPDQGGDEDDFLAVMEYKHMIDQRLATA